MWFPTSERKLQVNCGDWNWSPMKCSTRCDFLIIGFKVAETCRVRVFKCSTNDDMRHADAQLPTSIIWKWLKLVRWRWIKHWKSKQARWRVVRLSKISYRISQHGSFFLRHSGCVISMKTFNCCKSFFIHSLHPFTSKPLRHPHRFFAPTQLDYETPWVDKLLSTHHTSSRWGSSRDIRLMPLIAN